LPELLKGKVWHERKDAKTRTGEPVVTYPVLAEPKYDEIRCHVLVGATYVEFLSYSGKPLANMEGFAHIFSVLSTQTGYHEFDCGFEVNSNFNDSYRWVRSTTNFPPDLIGVPTKFILFDLPENTEQYKTRKAKIIAVAELGGLSYAPGSICNNEAEVDAAFCSAREAGLEGLMIKSSTGTYQRGKRTDAWLKYKPEDDADGTITEVYEAISIEGVPLGRAGSVQLVMDDGSEAAPHGIAHALGVDIWENPAKYIGQRCEFFFMERDRKGGYRHPTFHRIRE